MKKIILSISAIAFAMIIGCGKTDKIAETRTVLNGMTSAYENLIGGLAKAVSAKDVADSLNKFTENVGPLIVKSKELEKKYPEIRFSDMKNPPKELEADFKKFESVNKQFMDPKVTASLGKYAADPAVSKALNSMMEKLSIK